MDGPSSDWIGILLNGIFLGTFAHFPSACNFSIFPRKIHILITEWDKGVRGSEERINHQIKVSK